MFSYTIYVTSYHVYFCEKLKTTECEGFQFVKYTYCVTPQSSDQLQTVLLACGTELCSEAITNVALS